MVPKGWASALSSGVPRVTTCLSSMRHLEQAGVEEMRTISSLGSSPGGAVQSAAQLAMAMTRILTVLAIVPRFTG